MLNFIEYFQSYFRRQNRFHRNLIVMLFVIVSCTDTAPKSQPVSTPSLFSSEEFNTCSQFNCLYGITAGSSTMIEARSILEEFYGESLRINTQFALIEWVGNVEDGYSRGLVEANEQGIVRAIYLYFSEGQLSIDELIQWLGEPDLVWVMRAFSSDVLCAGSFVTYPDIGIYTSLYPMDLSIGIRPTQSVAKLRFVTLEESRNWSITDSYQFSWQGYIEYCDLVATEVSP